MVREIRRLLSGVRTRQRQVRGVEWLVQGAVIGASTGVAVEIARLCGHAVSEQLWYRQWVMWSRLRALWRSLRGRTDASAESNVPSAPAALTNAAMGADRPVSR